MLEVKVLVVKLVPVDGFSTSATVISEVTTLEHEVRNDAMKDGILVVKWLSFLANSLLTSAESTKVFDSFWDVVTVETHDNALRFTTANFDVKEYFGRNFRAAAAEGK